MASSFVKWEADPFFPAAEEVQNSADRMESAYRTWKRVKARSGGGNINSYRRKLITALDTVKWQLQEFERAVEAAVAKEQQHRDKDAPSRHALFVKAIKSQVYHAEKDLEEAVELNDLAVTCINSKPEDEISLVKFLSGSPVDCADGPHDNHELFEIMHSKFGASGADGSTKWKDRNVVISLSEDSPTASELGSSMGSSHYRNHGSFVHWPEYREKETNFVEDYKSIFEKSLSQLEELPGAAYSHETSRARCTDNWTSPGIGLKRVDNNIPDSENIGIGTDTKGVSEENRNTRCPQILKRNWNDGEHRSMEASKDIWLFPSVQMPKSPSASDLERGTSIKSGNCHKVSSCYFASDFYNRQKRKGTALTKSLQVCFWMQQRIPHGRILQIFSALLILISFVGITIM